MVIVVEGKLRTSITACSSPLIYGLAQRPSYVSRIPAFLRPLDVDFRGHETEPLGAFV